MSNKPIMSNEQIRMNLNRIKDIITKEKYELNKTNLAVTNRYNDSNTLRGNGLILIHETDHQLLPVLHNAIEQAGFDGSENKTLWLKELTDGSTRALVIYCYNETSPVPLHRHVHPCRNVIFLTASANTNKVPTLINTVYHSNSNSTENVTIQHFDVPNNDCGSVLGCDMMFQVEPRNETELHQYQIDVVKTIQRENRMLQSKYFVTASIQQQHELALFLGSITPHFGLRCDKRIVMLRFRKDTPSDVPGPTELLHPFGVEAPVLFKATNDHFMCYYVYVDQLFSIIAPKYNKPFPRPWFLGLHPPCWKFTESLLNHPNNADIVHEIRLVLNYMQRESNRILGGGPSRCDPVLCKHEELFIE